ncbi:unnamed protein product, partial [Timema podura]|nr:unnamed protein product [Timema podura]
RMWNRGINSDAVLRLSGKSSLGIPGSTRGSRGGSVDRGRGRGRGGYHYTRGLSYEEPGDGVGPRLDRGEGPPPPPSSTFIRSTRPFDRSQSAIVGERGWVDRNGTDPVDWNGAHSPRKEFGAGGRSFLNENWRRHRPGEDEEGWRTATGGRSDKWNRNSGSWREGDKEGGVEGERGIRSSQPTVWERNRGWDDGHHPHKRPFDEDHLPEW